MQSIHIAIHKLCTRGRKPFFDTSWRMTKQGKEAQKRAICLPPLISIADCEIPVELMACSFVTPFLYNASNNSYVHSRLNKNVATPKFNCTHNKVCVVSCSKDPTSRNTTRREAIGTLFSTAALSITIPLLLAEKPTVDKPEQLRKDVEVSNKNIYKNLFTTQTYRSLSNTTKSSS